jgi:hypothetical protein
MSKTNARLAASLGLALTGGCYDGLDAGRADGGDAGGDAGEDADDDAGEDAGDDGPSAACLEDGPTVGDARMRLMTRYEYDNTVRDLLGDTTAPARAFAPENRSGVFENDASDHQVSKDVVRQFLDASEDIAARAVAERLSTLLPCDPIAVGEQTCGASFVVSFLQRAFRRPATAAEIASFSALFDSAWSTYGFNEAVAITIQGVLQSPQFLYRIEAVPEGAAPGDVVAVDDWEMASRLSYFLVSSMPDDELFAAAANGELHTADQVEAQARRLIESEGAKATVREFHRQWLGLGALSSVAKDPAVYPDLDPVTFASDWNENVQAFVEHVFANEGGTMAALFSSTAVFLSPELATFYGAQGQDPSTGAWTLPDPRAGLLTQPGMLGMLAYPDGSSPVARGVFVRKRLLCQELTPPPNVPIEPPSPDPNATTRERFEQHSSDPACSGCHALIDPLGFTFENYDGAGRYRTTENDKPIDASGEIVGIEDEEAKGPVANAVELSAKLAIADEVQECVVAQWTRFALGRPPTPQDECTVATLQQGFVESDGDIIELMVAIATSDAFRFRVVDGGGA